jgi:hypothetical protein
MQNTMTIAYETVKYYTGAAGEAASGAVPGFANPSHYDTTPSARARPGSTSTIFGQGGLLDAAGGIVEDLESRTLLGAIGAVQKAGTAYNTFKGQDLRSATKSEAVALGVGALTAAIPGAVRALPGRNNGAVFPTPQSPVRTPGINPNAN